MKLQKLYSKVRQALDDYNMITENDKIAIGVSGGKDSLTLLYALSGIRSFYPVPFELVAIAVDLGYEDFDLSPVKALCDELSVEFYVVKTDIGRIFLEKSKNQASPCSWCAKLRKGALNDFALSVGCNKIAYAHHMDDIIETMFLSLLYEGQFYSFAPVTQLDGSGLAIIRPLMYVGESDVKGFKNKIQSAGVQESMPLRRPHTARICKAACQTAQYGKSGCQEETVFCYSKRQYR